jgi:hypothetical protein
MVFKGFGLIKLIRAVTEPGTELSHSYEVVIHDKLGNKGYQILKIDRVDREWTKLRMNGHRYAKLIEGDVVTLTEEEYDNDVAKWEARK